MHIDWKQKVSILDGGQKCCTFSMHCIQILFKSESGSFNQTESSEQWPSDGAYETETWTLCKATNTEWILWKMTKLNSLIQSITWTVQDQTIKVEVKVEVLIQRDTKYLVCLWEAGLYSGKHFKNLPNILWFSLNFHNKS